MSNATLTNRLKRADESTIASLLRKLLISPVTVGDALTFVSGEEEELLGHALVAAGVTRKSLAEEYSARSRVRDVLSSAMQFKVLAKPAAKKAKERLAVEGILPLAHYQISSVKQSKLASMNLVSQKETTAALEQPLMVDHFVLSPDLQGERAAVRIVVGRSERADLLVIVLAEITANKLRIIASLFVHQSDLERRRVTSAVEALRAFLSAYGVPGRIGGGRRDVLYLAEVVPQHISPDGTAPLFEVQPDRPKDIEFLMRYRPTGLQVLEVAYAFALDTQKYTGDDRLFRGRIERRRRVAASM